MSNIYDTKDKQINLRVSRRERDLIKEKAKENGFSSVAEYIVSASLNKLSSIENESTTYTLTLNPAIDYIITTPNNLTEITNFDPKDKIYEAGGKGINASIIMEEYGVKNIAIHYSGGFSGDLINQQLSEKGISNRQVKSLHETRINLKLNFADDSYEINSTASPLTSQARNQILKMVSGFNDGDTLMIMGSYHSDDEDFLFEISDLASLKNVDLVYDISKPVLKNLMKFKPLIIKPNKEELENIFDIKVENDLQIIESMKQLKKMGAKNVAITMGKDGAFILDEKNELYKAEVEPIKLVSPQGSGDSFISTFVAMKNQNTIEAFQWANAAGAATAQVKGLANYELIEKTKDKVKVEKIKS